MVQRFLIKPRLAALMVAVALGTGIPTAFAAPADDLKDAQRLYGQGKLAPAMEKVDAFLKVQPRDPQGRFLKGLVLTEQKRVPEAIQVFTGLTEDFPELPEPYKDWTEKNRALFGGGTVVSEKKDALPSALELAAIQAKEKAAGFSVDEPSKAG